MSRMQMQIGLFVLLLTADQLSKWWIEQQPLFFHTTVIDGFFNIVRAHNTGVAFSLFANMNQAYLLTGITLGIAAMVAIWWWRERCSADITPWLLLLILAGAAGNIWDRIQHGFVVDFLDFYLRFDGREYHWPAFNVADTCISIGVVLLVFTSFKKR